MTVSLSVHPDQEAADDNNEPARTKAEAEIGINLSEGEFPGQSFANNPTAEVINDPDGTIEVVNYNEPGVLWGTRAAPGAGFKSASGGGAGGYFTLVETVDFRERFGSGPYLDRTDDLTIHAEAADEQLTGSSKLDLTVTLYWSVEEMPEGRASFARP